MIPAIYLERQTQAAALINEARAPIITSAIAVIQSSNLQETSTCINEIKSLREKLYVLFEMDVECTKIALKAFFTSEIFPLLKQRTLTTITQKISSLNAGVVVPELGVITTAPEEPIDSIAYENYIVKLAVLEQQLRDINNDNIRTITLAFRDVTYSENGFDLAVMHQHPKRLKRTITATPGIDYLVQLFDNALYVPIYISSHTVNFEPLFSQDLIQ